MKKILIPFLSLVALLVSCEQLEQLQEGLTIDDANKALLTQTVPATATEAQSIQFTAADVWTAEVKDATWLTVTPGYGGAGDYTLQFKLEENKLTTLRTGKITLTCKGKTENISITQEAAQATPGDGLLSSMTFTMVPQDGDLKELLEKQLPKGAFLTVDFTYKDKKLTELKAASSEQGQQTLSYEYSGNNLTIKSNYLYQSDNVYDTATLDAQGKVLSFRKYVSGEGEPVNTVNYDAAGHFLSITQGDYVGTWYSWFDIKYSWSSDELQSITSKEDKGVRFKPTQYLNTTEGADIFAVLRWAQTANPFTNAYSFGEIVELTMPGLMGKRPKHIAEPVYETTTETGTLEPAMYTEVYVNGAWKTCEQLGIETVYNLDFGTWKVRRPASQPVARKHSFPAWKWEADENGKLTRAVQPYEAEMYSHEANLVVQQANTDYNGDGVINDEDRTYKIQNEVKTLLGTAKIDLSYVFTYK